MLATEHSVQETGPQETRQRDGPAAAPQETRKGSPYISCMGVRLGNVGMTLSVILWPGLHITFSGVGKCRDDPLGHPVTGAS